MASDLEKAEKADLVTFPAEITGAVCANCRFVDLEKSYCLHPEVDQKLKDGPKDMCCSFWDANGVKREWETKETKMSKKSFTEKVDKELQVRMAMTSDEYSEDFTPPRKEVSSEANPSKEPTVPGGAPGPKDPDEIKGNPNEVVNNKAVEDMGAKSKFAMDHEQAVKTWDTITSGATHKITKCMESVKGKVSDPGAYCKFLAEQAGYKPEQ